MKIEIFRFSPSKPAPTTFPGLRKWWTQETADNPKAKPVAVYKVQNEQVKGPASYLKLARNLYQMSGKLKTVYLWLKTKLRIGSA